ncbi:hypothetical protein U0D24_21845 [Hafnia paralvei]
MSKPTALVSCFLLAFLGTGGGWPFWICWQFGLSPTGSYGVAAGGVNE